jgi:hypothetical protein
MVWFYLFPLYEGNVMRDQTSTKPGFGDGVDEWLFQWFTNHPRIKELVRVLVPIVCASALLLALALGSSDYFDM